uniref:Uncharacterized protein n=1 Tax=Lepeophtheirus salmonis TaxID=72036 RepID=A0A0K2VF26_LEPSM
MKRGFSCESSILRGISSMGLNYINQIVESRIYIDVTDSEKTWDSNSLK